MPNEKRSKMIDGEAEDLLSRPQEQQEPESQKRQERQVLREPESQERQVLRW